MISKRSGPAAPVVAMAAVLLLTALVFLPSLQNGFVDWDDGSYVTENTAIRAFSPHNVRAIFTQSFVGCYCPLAVLSYAVEYRFFGLDPAAYHATNYILHLAATALVFFFVYLLSRHPLTAFIAALMFGVHPMHVESVAWISERKDLLCAVFYLLTLIWYQRYSADKKPLRYALCVIFALFSSLSKPMAVTIPAVLFLLDYFNGRRQDRRSLLEKAPFVALAAAFVIINMHFQTLSGATTVHVTGAVRLYFLTKTLLFYIAKFFLPFKLSAYYPYAQVSLKDMAEVLVNVAALAVLLGVMAWAVRKRAKTVVFGGLFFLITVLPVIQIVPAGFAFAADRYTYIPYIGLFYMLAAGYEHLLNLPGFFGRRALRSAVTLVGLVAIVSLSFISWNRCLVWKDTGSLFGDVIKKHPNVRMPYFKLGRYHGNKGDFDTAEVYFEKALRINEGFEYVHGDMSLTGLIGKYLDETRALKAARDGKAPPLPSVGAPSGADEARRLNGQGIAEGKAGRIDEAIALFDQAVRADPAYAESYNNLGYAYYRKGDTRQAIKYFKKALEIDPAHKRAAENLRILAK